jgi:hypothetical protein
VMGYMTGLGGDIVDGVIDRRRRLLLTWSYQLLREKRGW